MSMSARLSSKFATVGALSETRSNAIECEASDAPKMGCWCMSKPRTQGVSSAARRLRGQSGLRAFAQRLAFRAQSQTILASSTAFEYAPQVACDRPRYDSSTRWSRQKTIRKALVLQALLKKIMFRIPLPLGAPNTPQIYYPQTG